jgi:hypothetical protein
MIDSCHILLTNYHTYCIVLFMRHISELGGRGVFRNATRVTASCLVLALAGCSLNPDQDKIDNVNRAQARAAMKLDGFPAPSEIDFQDNNKVEIDGLRVGHCVLNDVEATLTTVPGTIDGMSADRITDVGHYSLVVARRYLDPLHLASQPTLTIDADNINQLAAGLLPRDCGIAPAPDASAANAK